MSVAAHFNAVSGGWHPQPAHKCPAISLAGLDKRHYLFYIVNHWRAPPCAVAARWFFDIAALRDGGRGFRLTGSGREIV